jgi:hypothetical protein
MTNYISEDIIVSSKVVFSTKHMGYSTYDEGLYLKFKYIDHAYEFI